jgi:transcriptional regulator with XRE-family HTH domain
MIRPLHFPEFSPALRRALLVKRMSQSELARALSVPPSSVSRWLNGSTPNRLTIVKIQQILDLPSPSTIPPKPTDGDCGYLTAGSVSLACLDRLLCIWLASGDESLPSVAPRPDDSLPLMTRANLAMRLGAAKKAHLLAAAAELTAAAAELTAAAAALID